MLINRSELDNKNYENFYELYGFMVGLAESDDGQRMKIECNKNQMTDELNSKGFERVPSKYKR